MLEGQVRRRGRKIWLNYVSGIEETWLGGNSTLQLTGTPDPPRPLYTVGFLSLTFYSPRSLEGARIESSGDLCSGSSSSSFLGLLDSAAFPRFLA